jgi:hypothetical protein
MPRPKTTSPRDFEDPEIAAFVEEIEPLGILEKFARFVYQYIENPNDELYDIIREIQQNNKDRFKREDYTILKNRNGTDPYTYITYLIRTVNRRDDLSYYQTFLSLLPDDENNPARYIQVMIEVTAMVSGFFRQHGDDDIDPDKYEMFFVNFLGIVENTLDKSIFTIESNYFQTNLSANMQYSQLLPRSYLYYLITYPAYEEIIKIILVGYRTNYKDNVQVTIFDVLLDDMDNIIHQHYSILSANIARQQRNYFRINMNLVVQKVLSLREFLLASVLARKLEFWERYTRNATITQISQAIDSFDLVEYNVDETTKFSTTNVLYLSANGHNLKEKIFKYLLQYATIIIEPFRMDIYVYPDKKFRNTMTSVLMVLSNNIHFVESMLSLTTQTTFPPITEAYVEARDLPAVIHGNYMGTFTKYIVSVFACLHACLRKSSDAMKQFRMPLNRLLSDSYLGLHSFFRKELAPFIYVTYYELLLYNIQLLIRMHPYYYGMFDESYHPLQNKNVLVKRVLFKRQYTFLQMYLIITTEWPQNFTMNVKMYARTMEQSVRFRTDELMSSLRYTIKLNESDSIEILAFIIAFMELVTIYFKQKVPRMKEQEILQYIITNTSSAKQTMQNYKMFRERIMGYLDTSNTYARMDIPTDRALRRRQLRRNPPPESRALPDIDRFFDNSFGVVSNDRAAALTDYIDGYFANVLFKSKVEVKNNEDLIIRIGEDNWQDMLDDKVNVMNDLELKNWYSRHKGMMVVIYDEFFVEILEKLNVRSGL